MQETNSLNIISGLKNKFMETTNEISLKIDSQEDRERLTVALANNGYAVRIVRSDGFPNYEYYVKFKVKE